MQKEGHKPSTEGTTAKPTNVAGNRPKASARVYSMGHQEVTDPAAVIDGTLSRKLIV